MSTDSAATSFNGNDKWLSPDDACSTFVEVSDAEGDSGISDGLDDLDNGGGVKDGCD